MNGAAEGIESLIDNAGDHAAAAVENAEAVAEAAIEAAEERVAAAEDAAEDIARAAMMTELGRQITETNERVELWQSQMMQEIHSLGSAVESLRTEMEALRQPRPVVVAVTETPPSSNLLSPETPPEPEIAAAVILPGAPGPVTNQSENTPSEPPRRRTRLI